MSLRTVRILIKGLVQGVGFRPFVFRTAIKHSVTGWVQNTNENVKIEASGPEKNIDSFITSLKSEAPLAASIEELTFTETDYVEFNKFKILRSDNLSDQITEISPDIAVCNDCLEDLERQPNRISYPFINCTNCGPRFTIIEDLPYDRASTTMSHFEMCGDCRNEYENIADRRFHAQPVACNNCGPHYDLSVNGLTVSHDTEYIIGEFSRFINMGCVVLIKGLGGMHLACDAFNTESVRKLRNIKNRDGKPFGIMFRDIGTLKKFAFISDSEERTLLSWKRPIVLLEARQEKIIPAISVEVNSGLNLIGAMLPYMPFHHLAFRKLSTQAIVLTSGNFHNEPIITDNAEAIAHFSDKVDAIILHNRDIRNRTDDSVTRIIDGKERIFRRSRGYVPTPLRTSVNTEGIVAFGAELTNTFAVGKGNKIFISQYIGDLQTVETSGFYEETLSRFIKLFRIRPSLIATDMHPGYYSTRAGHNFGDFPVVEVQHHHAHIASCMAEHRIDERVIGVAFDGTGYGSDGNIWGSEFMVCDLDNFTRVSHFDYLPLPGGDSAIEEPWKIAISWLYKVYGKSFTDIDIPLLRETDSEKIGIITRMTDRMVNTPLTSGAGRYFDAVASILGLTNIAKFQAEGPMRLESLIGKCSDSYSYTTGETICLDEALREIISDIINGKDKHTISAKLHNTIILTIFDSVNSIREKEGLNKVVLSGGVFQNKYLLEGSIRLLGKNGFEVFTHAAVPTNDGGISPGQLIVAAKRRELKCV